MKSGLLKRIKWKNLLFSIVCASLLFFICYKVVDTCWTSAAEQYEMMPSNAPLYISSTKQSTLANGNAISPLATQFIENSCLSNYLKESKEIRASIADSIHTEMLSGLFEVNNHEYHFLHAVYVGFHWDDNPEKFFTSTFLTKEHFEKRIFKSYTIYENALENANLSYTYKNGFLIMSSSPDLMDNFIRKYESGNVLSKDHLFKKAYHAFTAMKEANSMMLQFVLNYAQAASISELIATPRGEKLLKELATIQGYSVLALAIKESNFSLKGASAFDNDLSTSEKPSTATIFNYLPENVAILSAFDISKVDNKKNSLSALFSDGNIDKMAFFEIENRDVNDEKFAGCILHSKNINNTLGQLQKVHSGSKSSIVYGAQQIPLQGTTLKNELHDLFGHRFYQVYAPSYFYINDCIIFVNKAEAAQYIADHYFSKNTLKTQQAASYNFQFRQDLIPQLTEQLFKVNDSMINLRCIKNINKCSFSLRALNGIIETEWQFSVDKNSKTESTNIVWQSELQDRWISAPQIVEIPGTEHFYVVAQDEKNQVYFYNDAGELQWKKELESTLISNFYAIDYYNNASIQFAFHSANYLYIVDKYGNNIEDFPIRLGASANVSMTVFHQNNSLYQSSYFIPCSNGNIYGYDVKGAPLAGWNPKKVGVLKHSLQLVEQNKNTYLLGTTENTSVYAWDIKGAERFNLATQLFILAGFSTINVDTSSYLFNATHTHILKYSMDGKMEEKPFGTSSDTFDYLAFLPIESKVPHHAFMDAQRLTILDQAGKKLMSYDFTEKMNLSFNHVLIHNEDEFVCTNASNTKVYLINAKGALYDGFPANVSTGFSMITMGSNAYAVGMSDDKRIVCYRL